MKFICEKCKTKYSISDEKVRGKVLKIRCKNCSNIIVVREPRRTRTTGASPRRPTVESRKETALERAFDGAFKEPRQSSPSMRLAPVVAPDLGPAVPDDEFLPEATRLSEPPDFPDQQQAEEEWYLAVDGHQFGPMGFGELCSRIKRGETGPEAYVWRDGYEDWFDIEDIPELKKYIPRHPPSPPPTGKSGLFSVAQSLGHPPHSKSDESGLGPAPESGTIGDGFAPPLPSLPPRATPGQGPPPARPSLADLLREEKEPSGPAVPPAPAEGPAAAASPVDELSATPAPAALAAAAEAPAADSGLMTPSDTRRESQSASALVVPPPAQPGTPMIMKVTAAGGIIAALTGLVLVFYFIFIDRPVQKPEPVAQVASTIKQPPEPPKRAGEIDIDPSAVEVEFPAERIERTKIAREKTVRSRPRSAPAQPKPAQPQEPKLTAAQLRLKRLYGSPTGGSGGPKAGLTTTKKKRRAPSRRITSSEITSMQRRYKSNLKACYERALKRDDALTSVKAEITVTIGDSGMVREVKVLAGDSIELRSCLIRVIRRWVFPDIGEQTFGFPILFRGS